jgi:predicted Rossmann fold nucleotide-binding protein DprA/Smf involved in DNA uptake
MLLLISRLRQSEQDPITPLRPSEYLNLIKTLNQLELQPGDLFEEANLNRLNATGLVDCDRLSALFARGLVLAIALEKWAAQGIWVIDWSDPDYPESYKSKLKGQAPPLLYGIGEKSLLSSRGLAIVGSRDADEAGVSFARQVAESCAAHNVQVVSGGARGIDSEAMLACLNSGGSAAGVLSDSLARQAVSGRFREAVVSRSLVLVSPFEPEARFFIGNAMARNRLIYALADFALVISSDHKKGGTWTGAVEDLDKGWTPLFVRNSNEAPPGNAHLIDAGAIPIDEDSMSDGNVVAWMEREAASHGGVGKKTGSQDPKPFQGTLQFF